MATLSITKTYADNSGLEKIDIDYITGGIEDFINIEKITATNIQSQTLENTRFNSSIYDNTTITASSSVLEVKDGGISDSKLVITERHASIGTICCFHDFSGALSIPRGWMLCNGDVINETKYDSLHGSGSYDEDSISSSALLSKYLPDFSGKYARGAAATTQTGSSAITTAGNTDNEVDLSHDHLWYDYKGTTTNAQMYNNGIVASDVSANLGGSYNSLWGTAAGGSYLGQDAYTSTELSTTFDITPLSRELKFIMKVI